MHINKAILVMMTTIMTLCTNTTSAWSYDIKHELTHGHGTLQLGGYWGIINNAEHINISGLIGDDFDGSNGNRGSGVVGVGYYVSGPDIQKVNMSYGINWFFLGKTSVGGTVTQENLFTNLAYGYNVTNYPLYVMAKSTFQTPSPNHNLTLDLGIGPNFMTTGNFQEQSLGADTIPDQIFTGTTTTTFAATVGVGVKFKQFFGKVPLECGYRFFYLGTGNFNALNNQVVNNLNTGPVYANAVMCAMTI